MAHFAEIDENNIVKRVLVVHNSQENRGQDFLAIDMQFGGTWIQTSYNNSFRKKFAGIGYYYDEVNDVFISPQPYASWILDENFDWKAPVDYPNDDKEYYWDEDLLNWIEYKI
jgi:hypothetical protein